MISVEKLFRGKTCLQIPEANTNYECDKCQKTFRWKGNIARHVKNVHETNPKLINVSKTSKRKDELGRPVKNVY